MLKVRHPLVIVCLAACLCPAASQTKPASRFYDPVQKQIEGWTVAVDPRLFSEPHREIGEKAIKALANHLQRITYVMPKDRLAELRRIPLWLELDNAPLLGLKKHNMQYHPNRNWLIEHDLDPRLAKHVHMPSAKELYDPRMWTKHPYVILHELAHAYHDQILKGGFKHAEIMAAFKKAKASGDYEKVLSHTGRTTRHYGLSDQKEYFAEATEAYFGVNDFYPFVRAELKEFDPAGFAVMEAVWGPLRGGKKSN